jgi:hypothetical protein
VVAVEMRDDDVAHVVPVEAESLDLMDGGFHGLSTGRMRYRDGPTRRASPQSLRPEAGVERYQTVAGLDEQHVAPFCRTRAGTGFRS